MLRELIHKGCKVLMVLTTGAALAVPVGAVQARNIQWTDQKTGQSVTVTASTDYRSCMANSRALHYSLARSCNYCGNRYGQRPTCSWNGR
jgi:hypothetical protein